MTLSVTDRKLSVALDALLSEFALRWGLRDGVLWVTTPEVAEEALKTAAYDVRDLCVDLGESMALRDALFKQTDDTY